MAPTIEILPAETLEAILSCLEDEDVMKLSMACKVLRNRTAHRVFHTVRFSNDARIADSALAAAQRHGPHIKILRFVGYASEEDDSESDHDEAAAEAPSRPANRDILPLSALTLFDASTALLPNLETFSINFDHDYGESIENCPHGAAMFKQRENWPEVHAREAKLTMCRLWANTYKALAASKTSPPGLILENWSPRGVSTFQTPEWRAYLSRLKSLDIRITAAAEAWHFSNSMRGYAADIARMHGYFFAHLTTLRTLKLSIWPFIPFGMHGRYHLPLPIQRTTTTPATAPTPTPTPTTKPSMPLLTNLELTNVFISPDLLTFLLAHKTTLHTITLNTAHSAATEYGECAKQPLSWAAFFDALSSILDAHPREEEMALTTLTLTTPAPLSETEAKTGKARYKSERAAIKKVRDELAGDGSGRRRLFGYGDLGEGDGCFVHCVKTNQESAIQGVDQEAWERFVVKLEGRRGKGGGGGGGAVAGSEGGEGAGDASKVVAEAVKAGKAAVEEQVAAAEGSSGVGAAAEAVAETEARVIPRRPKRKEPAGAPAPPVRRSGRLAKMRE